MIDGQTLLLTGASSGIGLACAQRLLGEGYRVIGLSRRGAVPELERLQGFTGVGIDLADLDSLAACLKKLLAEQSIDHALLAAGQGRFGSIEQFSVRQIDQLLRVNLTANLVICRALLPAMRKRGQGRIIAIGSESALRGGARGAVYCASKFGLRGFCQSLREDVSADGIGVSLVNPGMVRSPFFDSLPFAPGPNPENALGCGDVADAVVGILASGGHLVIDEINLSPRVRSIDRG